MTGTVKSDKEPVNGGRGEKVDGQAAAPEQPVANCRISYRIAITALVAGLMISPILIHTEKRGDPQLDALKKAEEDALLNRHRKLSTAIRESHNRHDLVIDDQLVRELQKYLSDVDALSKKK